MPPLASLASLASLALFAIHKIVMWVPFRGWSIGHLMLFYNPLWEVRVHLGGRWYHAICLY